MTEPDSKRKLRRGPDLSEFVDHKRRYTDYLTGAHLYSMRYSNFVKLVKEAHANIRIKKNVIVDLEVLEAYLEEHCHEGDQKDEQTKRN